jgi:hypothetical protein
MPVVIELFTSFRVGNSVGSRLIPRLNSSAGVNVGGVGLGGGGGGLGISFFLLLAFFHYYFYMLYISKSIEYFLHPSLVGISGRNYGVIPNYA